MRRSIRIKNIILIIIMILMVVITVFPSCSADNSSLTLCNVSLDYDNSRSFRELSLDSKLTNSNLLYKADYLGSGSSYGAKSAFVPYPDGGLILSQGLWKIDCKWMNGDTLIAEGTTRDIWVNLNTTSIIVYLEENIGKGSFSLGSYKVICTDNSVTSISYDISLCKYNNGLFDSNIIFADSEIEISADSDIETDTETGCISTLKLKKDDLDSGAYLLTIKVFNGSNKTDANLLFTDVLGFMEKEGHETAVTGSCEVIKGTTGSNKYIYWEEDPKKPTEDKTVPVGGSNTAQLDTTATIENEHIYIVNPDTDSSVNMSLGHTTTSTDHTNSNRIVTPEEGTSFGINMQGTNVIVTIGDKGVVASKENTTIIELKNNVSMTLYNHSSSGKDATWGLEEVYYTDPWGNDYYRRYQCNTSLNGGTLNVVGPYSNGDSISNGKIVFQGPLASDNIISGINGFYKQGAINISSRKLSDDNGGKYEPVNGTINLDGNVEVIGVTGISSWVVDNETTSINGTLNLNINILNGASIKAEGDSSDISEGIFIKGNNQTGIINIILDNGHINASGSPSSNEAGIRIENFSGEINITIKNNSNISSSNGYGLYFYNCSGKINISKDNTSTVTGKNNSNAIYISNSTVNVNGTDYTSTLAKI